MYKKLLYFSVIILIFSLIIIFYKYRYYISIYFSSPNNYNHYRLGDMVLAPDSIRNNFMGIKYHQKHYPETIAVRYINNTNERENYEVLHKIVLEYNKDISPEQEELIIHLRLGDIINYTKYTVNELLENEKKFEHEGINYVKSYSYYDKIIKKNKLPKNFKIFGGGCFTKNKDKSYEYIEKIKKYFINNGFNYIENNYFTNPDEDFVYMSRSKNFIQSGGNFSKLIAKMVIMNGGKVYN